MNELVQLVMQKTGLSQDKAQEIVDTVVNHFKARLPESVSGHLDALLAKVNSSDTRGLFDKAKSFATELGVKLPGQSS